jgi:hypothetical protein
MMWAEQSCDREPEVRQMVRIGSDDPALREHAARCAVCGETLAVAALMQELAALPVDSGLPDPGYLWCKGELLRQWDAQRRVAAPVERGQPVQVLGIGLVGTLALLVWLWRQMPGFASTTSGSWADTLALTALVSVGLLVVIGVISLRDLIFETDRKERT